MSDPVNAGTTVFVKHEDLSEDLRRICLGGRLDMIGVGEIELPFTALAATRPIAVLVDLTGVSFLASVGLRCIIQSAKALDLKGGRMALLVGDNPLVRRTLDAVGIAEIIPTFFDESAALDSLRQPQA
jgi:anti-sigma B factor antagonist